MQDIEDDEVVIPPKKRQRVVISSEEELELLLGTPNDIIIAMSYNRFHAILPSVNFKLLYGSSTAVI